MAEPFDDLSSPDPAVRRRGCWAAARIAQPSAELVARLIEMLADPGYEEVPEPGAPSFYYPVGEEAAATLSRWTEPLARAEAAVWSVFDTGRLFARIYALPVVAQFGRRGWVRIARVLADPAEPAALRIASAKVLGGTLGATRIEDAELFGVILRCLDDHDSNVVWAAHEALTQAKSTSKVEPVAIVAALAAIDDIPRIIASIDKATEVFERAYGAVAALGHFVGWQDAAAALARNVLGAGGSARHHAAESLHRVGAILPEDTVAALVTEACATTPVAIETAEMLAAYGSRAAALAPGLVAMLRAVPGDSSVGTKQSTAANRRAAAAALHAIAPGGGPVRAELIDVFLTADDEAGNAALAILDPRTLPRTLVPELTAQLSDAALRPYALRALAAFGADALPALSGVRLLLVRSSPGPVVRHACEVVEALGPAAVAAIPELVDLLETPDRLWVLHAIAAIGPVARPEVETFLEILLAEARARKWGVGDLARALAAIQG